MSTIAANVDTANDDARRDIANDDAACSCSSSS